MYNFKTGLTLIIVPGIYQRMPQQLLDAKDIWYIKKKVRTPLVTFKYFFFLAREAFVL
tara:strand:+ start:134 stop:307 length:174 start_codon:yes stop_codon:yes gene_type:complete